MSKKILWVRSKRYFKSWLRIVLRDALEPLTDTAAQIHLCLLFVTVFVILPPKGYDAWRERVSHLPDAAVAFMYALYYFCSSR